MPTQTLSCREKWRSRSNRSRRPYVCPPLLATSILILLGFHCRIICTSHLHVRVFNHAPFASVHDIKVRCLVSNNILSICGHYQLWFSRSDRMIRWTSDLSASGSCGRRASESHRSVNTDGLPYAHTRRSNSCDCLRLASRRAMTSLKSDSSHLAKHHFLVILCFWFLPIIYLSCVWQLIQWISGLR